MKRMVSHRKAQLSKMLFAIMALLLTFGSACQPAAPLPPAATATSAEDAYIASEATISAQLTGIAEPGASNEINPALLTVTATALELPTETLPATSTPLPTKTPYPTDEPEPQLTATPETIRPVATSEPTQDPDDPKSALGEPDWVDEFETGVVYWPLYNDEHVSMKYTEGQLNMTALVANRRDPWDSWMALQTNLADFYVEVTAAPGDCSGLDRYGLLARANPATNQTYMFGLSCDGKYSLRYWDGQKISMLKEWTNHPAINKGAGKENILGLSAVGSLITVYANGTRLFQINDETLTEGSIGLFVGAVMTDGFQVGFRRIAYWEIP